MDLKEYFREIDGQPEIVQQRVRRDASAWQWKLLRNVLQTHDRNGERLVFRRRIHPLVACDLAIADEKAVFGPVGDQLGNSARETSSARLWPTRLGIAKRLSTS